MRAVRDLAWPRSSRSADTREKMLEVAETRFAQKGYDGAHLESIARDVGVRKTALYYYFESKEALYVAVLERMLTEFDRTVSGVIESIMVRCGSNGASADIATESRPAEPADHAS